GHQVQTLNHALHACAHDGTVLYFGIPDTEIYPIDMERMVRQHLTLKSGVTVRHREALMEADQYLTKHPHLHELLVTHVFGRDDVQAAFDVATQASPERIKVLLDFT